MNADLKDPGASIDRGLPSHVEALVEPRPPSQKPSQSMALGQLSAAPPLGETGDGRPAGLFEGFARLLCVAERVNLGAAFVRNR